MKKILECVPNFSVGDDVNALSAIAGAIERIAGVALLHQDRSPGAARTVMTFAGEPEAVTEAAFEAIKVAAAHIDMRIQKGVHPRIGTTDVCPLIPLQGITMAETVQLSEALAMRVGTELGIPVYLYEHSTTAVHRKTLPQIRKGQYEGLEAKMNLPEWQPDYGPATFNAAAGATVMGARDILVAFNISLSGGLTGAAGKIAARMRESAGGLPKLRAIGWHQPDYNSSQVSMNLLDYRVTSPLAAFLACAAAAQDFGAEIVGSELIGLMPESCLLEAGTYLLQQTALPAKTDAEILRAGVQQLRLDAVRPFETEHQILERALAAAGFAVQL
jgi:glutamate formiminotransferase/formiminotetrahydrofolate cyclodeaminase